MNTLASTELCLRSARRFAGRPLAITVGDGGSIDGSREMLARLGSETGLGLRVETGCSQHAEWLDRWRAECRERWAVFVDSDIEFLEDGWLVDMVAVAEQTRAALVGAEWLPGGPYVEPVSHRLVNLVSRPAPWLMLLDTTQARGLERGFAFVAVETDEVPEGVLAYDVGAMFFTELREAGLVSELMPASFRRKYRHYGGMSWRRSSRGLRTRLVRSRVRYRLALARRHALT